MRTKRDSKIPKDKAFGLWRKRVDIQTDGLKYQRQLSSEWDERDAVSNTRYR